MEPGDGGFEEGRFRAGLKMIEDDGELRFEELLLKLSERKRQVEIDPFFATHFMLCLGARLRLREIYNSIDEVKPAYSSFAAWFRTDWQQHGVISFNWDLQAERALSHVGVPWHYSLNAQGRLPVIKPHGSINWSRHRQEDLYAHYPNWQAVGNTKLSFDAQCPLADPNLDENVPNLNFMLFPGDSDLPESHDDMQLLWQDAAQLVDKAEKIVFIGYSFPDYDCYPRQFFREWVRDKKIVAVNPSRYDLDKFPLIFDTEGVEIEFCEEKFGDCPYAQPVTGTPLQQGPHSAATIQ